MGRYLDRLRAEYDEILSGIEDVTNRAVEENRELTDTENEQIERDNERAQQLQGSIEHHADIEERRGKVNAALGRVSAATDQPGVNRSRVGGREPVDAAAELTKLFPTAGDFIVTAARAMRGEADAVAVVERAQEVARDTAHQFSTNNPGLLPRPILGPVINLITGNRRFINSIATRPLPAGKFDRPRVTQPVAVGIQPGEKQQTPSRELKVDPLPVESTPFGGHLNIPRQNVKWSTPSLMQLIVESFGTQYAIESESFASEEFFSSLTGEASELEVATWNAAGIRRILFAAAAKPLNDNEELGFPNTFWMSTDVWGGLGSLTSPLGQPEFPTLLPAAPSSGSIGGFNGVVVPTLPERTAVIGRGQLVEWYEDLDGFVYVDEPDVRGQLVGYGADGALLNTAPDVFTVLTFPEPDDAPDGGEGAALSTAAIQQLAAAIASAIASAQAPAPASSSSKSSSSSSS